MKIWKLVLGLSLILMVAPVWAAAGGNNNGKGKTEPTTTTPTEPTTTEPTTTEPTTTEPTTTEPTLPPSETTDPYPFVQEPFDSGNGLEVRFNGSNVNTTGLDYKVNGTDLNVVTRPTDDPAAGTTYSDPVLISGQYYIFEQKANPIDGTVERTGTVYQLQNATSAATATSATEAVLVVPGIASVGSDVGQLTGTSSTESTGINILNQKSSDQLMGGYNNTQGDRSDALDALVQSASTSATAFYDLNTGKWVQVNGQQPFLGTVENPVIAYARGTRDPVTGAINEQIGFHESQLKGVGLLVVEIDNPDLAQFELSGQSEWTGLVVVVVNKVPQKNSSRIAQIGGNTGTAVIGGAFLYFRNEGRATDTYNIVNASAELGMISGNASIKYSDMALSLASKAKPSAMVVRSWRKLSEAE